MLESREVIHINAKADSPENIDDYIAGFPVEIQAILEKIRTTIRSAAPDAEEAIRYEIPTFRLNGNLVHFAAFKNHIGFYPTPSGMEEFKEALSPYKQGKGSVQFSLDLPIPYDLMGRITKFRAKANTANAGTKSQAKTKKD
jgi:uncharacterized protein YdhG (YjbR/CyaY superfamily)